MSFTGYSPAKMQTSPASCGTQPMDSNTDPPTYFTMQSSVSTMHTPTSRSMPYTSDQCSSGFQSQSISTFPSTLPSSSSTTINEYPPIRSSFAPLPQTAKPRKIVDELKAIIENENDKVVSTNSVAVLFTAVVNNLEGQVCDLVANEPVILNFLYNLLTNDEFKEEDTILFLVTGTLTNLSKYEAGRSAILGCNEWPSRGIKSLINSLQSRDSNVVIVAITAVHNLLLDRRLEVQEFAKRQIKHADGIKYIVKQLANQNLINNYEFKVIVLDCLQILAYGNMENRLAILESGGPGLLLSTLKEHFGYQPTEELIETASRVLKSLSVCPENKVDIIANNGIEILTQCIKLDNQEILKTCLWTLRNLSDIINNTGPEHKSCINHLVERLLEILNHYAEEPCIVTLTLGVLANLTCNNEPVKQLIVNYNGVELLLGAIEIALRDSRDFRIVNNEILEPAVCALCHLMNQMSYPRLELERQRVRERFIFDQAFKTLRWAPPNEDLAKALDKLISLLGDKTTLYLT